MEDERCKFIYRYLNKLDVVKFFETIVNINSVKQLNYQIRLLITNHIQPFLDQKLNEWRTIGRYELGKQMPNIIVALEQLMSFIDEQITDLRSMEQPAFESIDNEYACNAFMALIFKKQFLERFEAPLVRLIKYHFVLYSKEKREPGLSRNVIAYRGKISVMLETLFHIDFLSDYVRSCVVLATSHIVSKVVTDQTSVPVTTINFLEFSKKVDFIRNWVHEMPLTIPDSQDTIRKYAVCAFISRLCDFSFEIFIEHYPETSKLVRQMQLTMKQYEWYGREELLQKLCDSIKSRLLHVGVNTRDILKAYARSVESLIAFDESFVLVHKVCDLIKRYVKTRPDTVRKIIKFITDERPGNSSNNFAQLVDRENLINVNDEYVIMIEDAENERWDKWQPDPYDANPTESRLFRESADVFNMLVSIYDCRDLFVKEYQNLLANNLIANGWGKQMDSEAKYLDHMKKRFTEGELNQCEVMLKDIRDSAKLYNTAVFDGMHLPFFPRVISYVFWPEFKKDVKLDIIEPFASYYKQYLKSYERKRQSRTINWYKDYGSCVKMDIKLGGCVLDVEVPLSYAQIVIPFLQKECISVNELLGKLGMDKNILMKRLEWWKEKGILAESSDNKDQWKISANPARMENAVKQSMIRITADDAKDSEGEEEAEISVEEQADALEQYWLYTKNLLLYHSTRDPLTPQKLANMYKMFSSPGKPPPTVDAVFLFMQRKIKQNLVVFENGAYKPDKELKSVFAG